MPTPADTANWTEAEWLHYKARLREQAERRYPDDPRRQNRMVYGSLTVAGWQPEQVKSTRRKRPKHA